MKTIAISGASGFVGTHLSTMFKKKGYTVIPLGRKDLKDIDLLSQRLEGIDALLNLAGANIVQRWSEAYKKVLYKSRIDTPKALIEAMKKNTKPPKTFISTSAIGIYKNDKVYDEYSLELEDNFLANLCKDWEAEAHRAEVLGIRTIITRFGIVMGSDGGALQKMLLPFKMGMGGVIGTGKQAFSSIHIEDLERFYLYAVEHHDLQGIYNMTTPQSSTNYGLTKALGVALHRPTILPLPSFVLKLIFGEGSTVLTDGQSALPKRVLESGFSFKFQNVEEIINDLV